MSTWVCLLRGVNLGARNKLNMAALRRALGMAGLGNVQSYLQSGNVIADAQTSDPRAVARLVEGVLAAEFDLEVPVVVRSPDRLRQLAAWCPFGPAADDASGVVHLLHLTERPDPDRVADLLRQDWSPDEVAVDGLDVAVRYAKSMHRSRLSHSTALRRLGVDGTARNWRTLQALIELTTDI